MKSLTDFFNYIEINGYSFYTECKSFTWYNIGNGESRCVIRTDFKVVLKITPEKVKDFIDCFDQKKENAILNLGGKKIYLNGVFPIMASFDTGEVSLMIDYYSQ